MFMGISFQLALIFIGYCAGIIIIISLRLVYDVVVGTTIISTMPPPELSSNCAASPSLLLLSNSSTISVGELLLFRSSTRLFGPRILLLILLGLGCCCSNSIELIKICLITTPVNSSNIHLMQHISLIFWGEAIIITNYKTYSPPFFSIFIYNLLLFFGRENSRIFFLKYL